MEDLDKLAADFVAGGCEPADIESAGTASHHGEDGPARTHGDGDTVRRFRHRGHDVEIVTHYDVTIAYIGHAERWDSVKVDGALDAQDASVSFVRDGRTLAVATVGRNRGSLEAEVALERDQKP